MDSRKLALLCQKYAENKKAENVTVLDVRKLSSVTDFYVIATGTSEPHLRAIETEIFDKLRDEQKLRPRVTEGTARTNWIVVDYFDVIVHLMRQDVRERYNLESLWSDAPRIRPVKRASRKATAAATGDAAEEPTAGK